MFVRYVGARKLDVYYRSNNESLSGLRTRYLAKWKPKKVED